MPGVFQLSVDEAVKEAKAAKAVRDLGIDPDKIDPAAL